MEKPEKFIESEKDEMESLAPSPGPDTGGITLNLNPAEGEWFDFFGSHIDQNTGETVYHAPSPAAKALIRNASAFIEAQMKKRKRKVENVLNPKTRQMERVSGFEEISVEQVLQEADELYDYAIMDLRGFKDRKTGSVIQCNREKKIALRRNELFRRYFERCQQILNGSAEVIEKN